MHTVNAGLRLRSAFVTSALAMAATLLCAASAHATDHVYVHFRFRAMGDLECTPTNTWRKAATLVEYHDKTVKSGSAGKPLYQFELVLPWLPCASSIARGVATGEVASEVEMQFHHATGAHVDPAAYATWSFHDVVFSDMVVSEAADNGTPTATLTFGGSDGGQFWAATPVPGANAVTHGPANIVLTAAEARGLEPVATNMEYQVALAWNASSAGPADSTKFVAHRLHVKIVYPRDASSGVPTGKPQILTLITPPAMLPPNVMTALNGAASTRATLRAATITFEGATSHDRERRPLDRFTLPSAVLGSLLGSTGNGGGASSAFDPSGALMLHDITLSVQELLAAKQW